MYIEAPVIRGFLGGTMDFLREKENVIEVSKKLLEYGLIVRTWGNISRRVSDTQFVITPSGKPYDKLTADDIVVVNIDDLSYEGDVKPSSEKGIHAECYKLRPEVNFVIHTHQMNASIVSALGVDIKDITGRSAEIIGDEILMGGYGLPGTKKLRTGVISALEKTTSNAVIMAHHGALCLGKDSDEAIAVANEVELVCAKFVLKKYKAVTGKTAESLDAVAKYIGDLFRTKEEAVKLEKYDSVRENGIMTMLDKSGNEVCILDFDCLTEKALTKEAGIHKAVYDRNKNINYIIHSDLPDISAMSAKGKKMKPLLDDFAQIAGATVKSVVYKGTGRSANKIAKSFKGGRNAVILKDNGALCCGKDKFNAEAAEMVVDKNSKAYIGAELFGNIKPINALESKLMNVVYRLKYSKQAD